MHGTRFRSLPALFVIVAAILHPGPAAAACGTDSLPAVDAAGTFEPGPLVGFGAATTGGRGGRFVMVTDVSDDTGTAGCLRWALQQHPGEPLYIVLAVEGEIALRSQLDIARPDVTIDGRFAPGRGCWLTGERIKVKDDNLFMDHLVHYGNDPSPDGNSDCVSWGDYHGTEDCARGYVRNCEFYHGADEVFAFTPRGNGEADGRTVADVTLENTVIANASGIDGHPLLYFIGDGVRRITNYHVLVSTGNARFPFVRQYADDIEFINCAAFNFNENAASIVGDAGIDFRGCLFRLGPRWNDIRAPFKIDTVNAVFLDDIAVDSRIGKINSYGLTRGGTAATATRITRSGLEPGPSGSVADDIAARCGALLYGGVRDTLTRGVLRGFFYGCAPESLLSGYGPERTVTDTPYPAANSAGVPETYLAAYPDDTDPEAIISDGSAWDGYMVAERIGAWLVTPRAAARITPAGMFVRSGAGYTPALYTLDGRRVTGQRTAPGIYVRTDGPHGPYTVVYTD